ncbi:MAG: DNA polymerase III subunit gamma/tau [Candidatus Jettenia sp.]|uniref:DNA polymerase III subunit gamma/tau n=1 Tax=Candidatus Jettenia caeni TaxID=247490 RepID=I3IPK0_9BACT|nr:DNA polymerase III subunit gamma/tau [Candidatus Jettenia sp. AMX1]MBC6929505.1 DNA polymerase III subunit gamma/tau [Candidatus Jettenia sp.]WKZ16096.1 MAG: DNA polymerase III subunit gamma/tau [Candidatus Jettenia caeni]KAA0249400.1 MAG: DNA polymerase III subunit gamma/tau [Candidatus Jettenia sp. AMX1]MCE7880929.1 DNA polymerase III subunit gamma/tau [Candidatus Jettenia sp. AMX1]MCQ3927666.1 DNA polymerase III subunit gamma/tau [Candidatus Jettenia sp.]
MSYVVLARRYRPQTFEDLVGQESIVTTLRNAIRFNRVAHAYLLAGPRGVGKTSMARIVSKALNCQHGPTDTPCNTCDICRCISEGKDIDVLEIDGASNRGIDEVRNIRQNVNYAPSRARYKIYIIDEVHMLTREAFNALLKTLEEPPPHVKFIFATTAVNRLPETVQSRCQRFDFKNISIHDIEKRLLDISKAEGVHIDPLALHMIARYAKGGLRDSQSVLDQLLSFCKDTVSLEDVNFVLGCIDEDKLLGMFDSFVKKEVSSALKIVDTVLNEGKTCGEFIDQMLLCIRELLIFSSCGQDAKWIEFNTSLIQRHGKSFSGDTLLYMIQLLSETRVRTTDSLLHRILLETAIIKLCRMESIGSLHEIAEKIASLEDRFIKLDSKDTEKKQEIIPAQKPLVPEMVSEPISEGYTTIKTESKNVEMQHDEKSLWEKILFIVQGKKKSTWSLLKEGRLTEIKDGDITIEFPGNYTFHMQRLSQIEEKKLIEQCIKEVLQSSVRLKFAIAKNIHPEKNKTNLSSDHDPSDQIAVNPVCSEPVVNKIVELFDGHVMKVNK